MIAPSRRLFLKSASLAAASIAIPASGVFAQSTQPSTPLGIGIIGTGHRGRVAHIPAIQSSKEMQLLAACDVMEGNLRQAISKLDGKVQLYPDYQKLLSNPDIDAVVIATPNCLHKEMVLAALGANKHVMCEKPMAVTYDECEAMKSAADAKPDRVVLYTMQLRYALRWNALRDAIEQGKIGKPRYALFSEHRGDWNRAPDVWTYDDPKLGKVNWRFSHAASGGTLSEKVCHYFDVLHWMIGETPATITCKGGISHYKDARDTWDHAITTITYPSGCRACHALCMFAPNRMDLQLVGDEGSLLISDEQEAIILQSKGKRQELNPPDEVPHRGRGKRQETAVLLMYQDFVDCVRSKKKPRMDADKAMTSCKTAWLGELSNEKQKEVKWEELA
jgi:predicted dehydrogenase